MLYLEMTHRGVDAYRVLPIPLMICEGAYSGVATVESLVLFPLRSVWALGRWTWRQGKRLIGKPGAQAHAATPLWRGLYPFDHTKRGKDACLHPFLWFWTDHFRLEIPEAMEAWIVGVLSGGEDWVWVNPEVTEETVVAWADADYQQKVERADRAARGGKKSLASNEKPIAKPLLALWRLLSQAWRVREEREANRRQFDARVAAAERALVLLNQDPTAADTALKRLQARKDTATYRGHPFLPWWRDPWYDQQVYGGHGGSGYLGGAHGYDAYDGFDGMDYGAGMGGGFDGGYGGGGPDAM